MKKSGNAHFQRLDKSKFSITALTDDLDDRDYWFSRSPIKRLEHLEMLRALNYGRLASSRLDDFLKLLNSHKVDYLLIGGYAVGYHGYPRATANIDIWIAVNPQNAGKMVKVIEKFGFKVPELSSDLFLQQNKIVRLGNTPVRIEILTSISGVDFDACFKNKIIALIDHVKVNIINLEDLKKNKKASGREKDLIDLKKLP